MVMSPQVSWLFFKAVRAGLAVKRPYLSHTGRASNAEKQPTGRGRCVENGPAAALLVSYVQHQFDGSPRKPTRYLQTSNWCWMRPPRALPTAHFERNAITIICETVH